MVAGRPMTNDPFRTNDDPPASQSGSQASQPGTNSRQVSRTRTMAVVLFGLLFCGGLLAVMLLPAISNINELTRKTTCTSSLKAIGVAMRTYHVRHGRLPPPYVTDSKGRPLYSWRVVLLPFLAEDALYQRFHRDEPWDSPHNRALAEEMPNVYRCPCRGSSARASTNYMVVVGEHTAFPGPVGLREAEFRDSLCNTLLVVETDGPGVCWTSPIDISVSTMTYPGDPRAGQGIGGPPGHGTGLLFCDGNVHRPRSTISTNVLRQSAIRDDGLPRSPDEFDK